jgi:hypothetical protein
VARERTKGTPDTLERWLVRQCDEAGDVLDGCVVELSISGDRTLSRWKGPKLRAPARAADMLGAAQDHCDEIGSVSSYVLRFLVPSATKDGALETQGSFDIRCRPLVADFVEAPTTEGQLAQQMRHNEMLHKTTLGSLSTLLEAAAELVKNAGSQRSDAQDEVRALRRQVDELRTELDERDDDVAPTNGAAKVIMDAIAPHVGKELGPVIAQVVKGALGAGEGEAKP